jgi:hypothetical protein
LLPRSRGLPQMAGGSASALSLSRPAQASHALRPAGSLTAPGRPLSRGFGTCSCPHEPLGQLPDQSTTDDPRLGAHCQYATSRKLADSRARCARRRGCEINAVTWLEPACALTRVNAPRERAVLMRSVWRPRPRASTPGFRPRRSSRCPSDRSAGEPAPTAPGDASAAAIAPQWP